MISNPKVFLGGTCAETTWREELIRCLDVESFNPVVKDWTENCQIEEENQKELFCDIHLYVITSEMIGTFSIAEAVDSARTPGKKTIFHVIPDGFGVSELKSLKAVVDLIRKRGGISYIDSDLMRTARVINYSFKE